MDFLVYDARARCLKITRKVLLALKNFSLRSNSVTRLVNFNKTKNWWKVPKLKWSNLGNFQTLCRLQSFGFRKASMYICKVGNKWMPEMLHFSSMLHEFYSSICGIFRILSSKLTSSPTLLKPGKLAWKYQHLIMSFQNEVMQTCV